MSCGARCLQEKARYKKEANHYKAECARLSRALLELGQKTQEQAEAVKRDMDEAAARVASALAAVQAEINQQG
jgi:hypothetical protein